MCGVVGIHVPGQEAAALAALGLFALQHRGQESAGVAVSDRERRDGLQGPGHGRQVLDEQHMASLQGDLAISHCRYSTTGSTLWENSQPTFRLGPRRTVAIGHNGNLVNTRALLEELPGGRGRLVGTTDTEVLTALLADEPGADLVEACSWRCRACGRYSLVLMDEGRVIGARDPYGFRPLVLGRLPLPARTAARPRACGRRRHRPGWVLASETAALDIVGADLRARRGAGRDRRPEPGGAALGPLRGGKERLCVFELIYFARPDSYMLGRNLYEARRRMGEVLAQEAPDEADLVMPVPDTGAPAAAGYRRGVRHPVSGGHGQEPVRRPDVHPAQPVDAPAGREHEAERAPRAGPRQAPGGRGRLHRARHDDPPDRLAAAPGGRRRGPPADQRAADLPPLLLRHRHLDRDRAHRQPHGCEGIREFVGADSLGFLSIGGVLDAIDLPTSRFCFACFDGDYPVPVPYDVGARKFMLEEPVPADRARGSERDGRARTPCRRGRGRRGSSGGAAARSRPAGAAAGAAGRPRRLRRRPRDAIG